MGIGAIGIAGALVLLHVRTVIKQEPGNAITHHHNTEAIIVQLMAQVIQLYLSRIQKNVYSINAQVIIYENDRKLFKNIIVLDHQINISVKTIFLISFFVRQ